MNTSNSFARIMRLVLGHLRGEARPRAKHQFRIGRPEMFEDRITPTTIAVHGPPYVPPGQNTGFSPVPGWSDPTTDFGLNSSANTLHPVITNNSATAAYVTFAIYTAPGGGEATTSNAYDNLASQKLIYSVTSPFKVAPNASWSPGTIDVTTLKLTGQQKFQCEWFDAFNDPKGYAPNKPTEASLDGHIIAGELFDYDLPNGTPGQNGPGR